MVANFWFMEAAIWSCKLLMERFTAGIERGHIYYVINYCTYDPDWDVTYGGPSESTSQRSARIILNLSPLHSPPLHSHRGRGYRKSGDLPGTTCPFISFLTSLSSLVLTAVVRVWETELMRRSCRCLSRVCLSLRILSILCSGQLSRH